MALLTKVVGNVIRNAVKSAVSSHSQHISVYQVVVHIMSLNHTNQYLLYMTYLFFAPLLTYLLVTCDVIKDLLIVTPRRATAPQVCRS